MRIGLIIVCFLGAWHLNAQDTICKLSGGCFVAEVRSQSKSEIKYTLQENVIGPAERISKKEISYVHFKDGSFDVYQADKQVSVDTNKIYRIRNGLAHKGKEISKQDLLALINLYPYIGKRKQMLSLHKKLRRNQRSRYTYAVLGIIAIPNGAFVGLMFVGLGERDAAAAFASGYFAAGSLLIGISQIYNFNYHKRKKQLVDMYNTF